MNFVRFLQRESPESWKLTIIVASLGGIANSALLAIINSGAEIGGVENFWRSGSPNLLFMFAVAMAIFVISRRYSMVLATQLVENMIMKLRIRVCDKIRKAELATVEHIDRNEVYTKISQDTNVVSQSSFVVIGACQDGIMLLFSSFYLFV